MYIFLTVLIVLAAILLTLLVLVQQSKGGGLASGFQSGNQVMGAPKTAEFLEKATWVLIAVIVVLSIAAVAVHKNSAPATSEDVIENAAAEAAQSAPQAPFEAEAEAE